MSWSRASPRTVSRLQQGFRRSEAAISVERRTVSAFIACLGSTCLFSGAVWASTHVHTSSRRTPLSLLLPLKDDFLCASPGNSASSTVLASRCTVAGFRVSALKSFRTATMTSGISCCFHASCNRLSGVGCDDVSESRDRTGTIV